MMEERYHATTQNRFYPAMSNVNKNITVEAKLISPPTYVEVYVKCLRGVQIMKTVCYISPPSLLILFRRLQVTFCLHVTGN